MDSWDAIWLVSLMIAPALLVCVLVYRVYKKMHRTMAQVADDLGLEAKRYKKKGQWGDSTAATGVFADVPVRIDYYAKGHGRSRTVYSFVRAEAPYAERFRFHILKRGFLTSLGIGMGKLKETHTGDAKFDEAFLIKAADPEILKTILLPEVREKILALYEERAGRGRFELRTDGLYYEEPGQIYTQRLRRRFVAATEATAELAAALTVYASNEGDTTPPLPTDPPPSS